MYATSAASVNVFPFLLFACLGELNCDILPGVATTLHPYRSFLAFRYLFCYIGLRIHRLEHEFNAISLIYFIVVNSADLP